MPRRVYFSGRGVLIGALVRNICEERVTLQTAMEAEIRPTIPSLATPGIRQIVQALESAILRNPQGFFKALQNICVLKKTFDKNSGAFRGWRVQLAEKSEPEEAAKAREAWEHATGRLAIATPSSFGDSAPAFRACLSSPP